jgi:hypothetical protein
MGFTLSNLYGSLHSHGLYKTYSANPIESELLVLCKETMVNSMCINSSTAEQYKVAYKSSGDASTYGAYTFDANLKVSMAE